MAAPDAQTALLSVPCNQLWLFDDVWPPTHVTCTSSGLCPQGRGSDPGPETSAVPADSAGVFAGSLNQHNQTERDARLREGARHVTGDSNAARETPDAGLPGPPGARRGEVERRAGDARALRAVRGAGTSVSPGPLPQRPNPRPGHSGPSVAVCPLRVLVSRRQPTWSSSLLRTSSRGGRG